MNKIINIGMEVNKTKHIHYIGQHDILNDILITNYYEICKPAKLYCIIFAYY